MKNKNILYALIVAILVIVMVFVGEKDEVSLLNYITSEKDGVTTYTIEEHNFIESDEPTDIIKISVKDKGIIIAELYPEIAPITVQNFKGLVSNNFYDGIIFHRVIKNFMIQTGDPKGTGQGGSENNIKGEFDINGIENKLSHTRGVLSMARRGSDPETEETMNSASSQFFIVHNDSTSLDGKYAAFGKVLYGMSIVDYIANVTTDEYDKPINNVVMENIRFVKVGE